MHKTVNGHIFKGFDLILKLSMKGIIVDCKESSQTQVKCKWDASENTIIEEKMQLVCNTVNMNSNMLYPELIDKCEC